MLWAGLSGYQMCVIFSDEKVSTLPHTPISMSMTLSALPQVKPNSIANIATMEIYLIDSYGSHVVFSGSILN